MSEISVYYTVVIVDAETPQCNDVPHPPKVITGSRRFHALIGVVMIVHAGFAKLLAAAPQREGTLSRTRLGPIQKGLQPAAQF